ncbi:polysaccharide deacetylase family protein [Stieleria marina]|uniref:Polysaccharide deacetylase n=1 Tax=Stieleria marina TaxID=1930275 RepID=A0A517NQJ1_9BACT|nr:Polysaccharide deacetylase [Planctomycetes bacterium K23_9]
MSQKKKIASISLDFDNKWAYLRAAGRDDWAEQSSYLPLAADRIVETLGELNLPLTVFIVGRDLADDQNIAAARSFDRLPNWEPANHSLNHLPWMHTMEPSEITAEIETTDQRIRDHLGRRPLGFRGPGFSCPDQVLRVLAKNDYVYDASIFPTSMAPIARAVFLMRTKLQGEQREKAKQLYGGFKSMRHPNRPFQRSVAGNDDRQATNLWEVPVTVLPFARTPIHFSYFTYLASFSTLAAKAYFSTALRLCRMTGTPPSLLLHPPDFMGREDDSDMAYFPAMNMARADKIAIVRWALKKYAESFDVRCMIDQVAALDPNIDRDSSLDTDHPAADAAIAAR